MEDGHLQRSSSWPIDDPKFHLSSPHHDDEHQSRTLLSSPDHTLHSKFAPQLRLNTIPKPKILARISSDDDLLSPFSNPFSFHHRRMTSMDQPITARVSSLGHLRSHTMDNIDLNTRGQIDTATPIQSVKAAVSMFGGNHRETKKCIDQELEKVQGEIHTQKKQCEAVEEARRKVVKEVQSTRLLIQEAESKIKIAETEEREAKQNFQFTKLQVEELEQRTADQESFPAETQLEVARARHATAISELQNVKGEMEKLKQEYASLLVEKDATMKQLEEVVFKLKQVEKSVGDLTIELLTLKQYLKTEQSIEKEAEEHRVTEARQKEEESLKWEKQLRKAEHDLHKLKQKVLSIMDLKSKLDEVTALLCDQQAKLEAYMDSRLSTKQLSLEDLVTDIDKRTRGDIEVCMNAAANELEQVKQHIEKTSHEIETLKTEAASLEFDLEEESEQLAAIKQKEATASTAISSLEAQMKTTRTNISFYLKKKEEERKKIGDLPERLTEAVHKAEHAKECARKALHNVEKAKEAAEDAKAEVTAMESQLSAVQKEIEVARAYEKLVQVAMALEKSENEDSKSRVLLSVEEYYELTKKAHMAEENASMKVTMALSEIEAAKMSESRRLKDLEEAIGEISSLKNEVQSALHKAEKAEEEKVKAEQELRQQRKRIVKTRMASPESCAIAAKKKRSYFSRFVSCLVKNKTRTAH